MQKFPTNGWGCLLAVGALLSWTVLSEAATPVFEWQSIMQSRENAVSDAELPWLNSFRLTTPLGGMNGRFSIYGQLFDDPLRHESTAELFQATLLWSVPNAGLEIQIGRLLINTSEELMPVDGGEFTLWRHERLSLHVFGGLRRHLEISNFDDASALIGFDLTAQPSAVTELKAGYRFEDDLDTAQRHWVVASIRQAVPMFWAPVFFGYGGFLADADLVTTGQVGVTLHPAEKLQLAAEWLRRDEADDNFEWRDQIFLKFTRGAEWQVRGSLAVQLLDGLTVDGAYSYQLYEVWAGDEEAGYQLRGGGRWMGGEKPLIATLRGFLTDGFGGKVVGVVTTLEKQLNRALWGRTSTVLAAYDKITGSEDYAFHQGVGVYYLFPRQLRLGVDSEFNSTIDQPQEWRVGVNATYVAF